MFTLVKHELTLQRLGSAITIIMRAKSFALCIDIDFVNIHLSSMLLLRIIVFCYCIDAVVSINTSSQENENGKIGPHVDLYNIKVQIKLERSIVAF